MYKYQSWSSGNEDCFSWTKETSKTNYNFAEIYGAKPSRYFNNYFDTSWYYKDYLKIDPPKKDIHEEWADYLFGQTKRNRYKGKVNKFNLNDIVIFKWNEREYEGMIDAIEYRGGNSFYTMKDSNGFLYPNLPEKQILRIKGKDNNMTTVTIDFNNNRLFNVEGPKFNTGDKVKFSADGFTNLKQGVIYSLNKKVTISKTGDEKEFKADKLQWFYTIIETGNLKTWNGIKENVIRIDDTPDYNKYFDLMSRCGMDFKRDQYTIISWNQYEATESTYSYGHRGYVTEVALKPKINDKVTKISFWVNSGGKLPPIGEKC